MEIIDADPDEPSMEAVVLTEFDSPLARRRISRPKPGPGEVLVAVASSGVNPLDLKIRAGAAPHAQVSPPAILGIDLAGTVVDAGAGVTAFRAGDEVYGMTGGVGSLPGSLAEFAVVDANLLAPKPQTLDARSAAALPLAGITAWVGMYERADVTAGATVLVIGGAGGVGHLAIQLALARGASVWATGSGQSLPIIEQLGGRPVDRAGATTDDYLAITGGVGFDVVFDTVGGKALDQAFELVRRRTGRVVSILGWGQHILAPLSFREGSYSGVFALQPLLDGRDRAHHAAVLRELSKLVDDQLVRPIIDTRHFDLDAVEDAHRYVAQDNHRGKVVIDVTKSEVPQS